MSPSEFTHLSSLLVGTEWGSQSRLATLLGVSTRMIRFWKSGNPKRPIPSWVEVKLQEKISDAKLSILTSILAHEYVRRGDRNDPAT